MLIEQQRLKDGQLFRLGQPKEGVSALEHLVTCELAFGGRFAKIEPNELVIETRVLDCKDTTSYSGDESELLTLFRLAIFFNYIVSLRRAEEFHLSNYPDVELTLPIVTVLGCSETHPLLLALLFAGKVFDHAEIEAAQKLNLNDMVSAIELKLEDPQLCIADLV